MPERTAALELPAERFARAALAAIADEERAGETKLSTGVGVRGHFRMR